MVFSLMIEIPMNHKHMNHRSFMFCAILMESYSNLTETYRIEIFMNQKASPKAGESSAQICVIRWEVVGI